MDSRELFKDIETARSFGVNTIEEYEYYVLERFMPCCCQFEKYGPYPSKCLTCGGIIYRATTGVKVIK